MWRVEGRRRQLDVGEEAMVEVTPFDDEVSQEVVGVPEEQKVVFSGYVLWQDIGSQGLSRWHEREGHGEREGCARIELEGRRGDWHRRSHGGREG